jgi:1-acyl-sn-glycerol-3-phosphate acyltransferase
VAWRTVPAFVAGGLATLAGFLVVWCRGPARADSAVTERLVRWWASVWLHAAGARVSVDGLEHVDPGASYVVVSNHQSSLDPIVYLRVLPLSLRALATRELFRITVLGRVMRMIGMIEVNREAPDFGEIDKAASRSLAAGHSLLVYPEGGISPDGTIREFKDGAFVIAAANQAPVLPVAIHGTRRIWPPGRPAIRSGQVRVTVGQPLTIGQQTHHDIAAARDQARDAIRSAHRDLVKTMSDGARQVRGSGGAG